MNKELCELLINEAEQSCHRADMDLYQTMTRAREVVEKWKRYAPLAQQLWTHATTRQDLTAFLLTVDDPRPEEIETVLTLIRTLPYLMRSYFQDAAASLPPSPGGRPRELTPQQRKEVCQRIGQLYTEGVELRQAQKRMAQHYDLSLRTIQRAWQERKWKSHLNSEQN